MAAHRYWRAVAMEAYGAGDLELSCFHLLDASGVRVDAPATLTASAAPTTGLLANLQDDDLATAARWHRPAVAALALNWDFGGSPVEVSDIRLAGDTNSRFALIVGLQWSDNNTAWTESYVFSGITWPGANAKTVSPQFTRLVQPSLVLHLDGADASTVFADSSPTPKTVSGMNTAKISTAQSKFGGASALFDGASGYLTTPDNTAFDFDTGDFTIEGFIYPTTLVGYRAIAARQVAYTGMALQFVLNDSALWAVLRSNTGAGLVTYTHPTPIVVNTWQHVAISRVAGSLLLFVGGAPNAPQASTQNLTAARPFTIGVVDDTILSAFFQGYIDDLRVSKRGYYSSAFTPPTAPLPNFDSSGYKVLLSTVKGRAASTDPITVGTGPPIIYGIPALVEPVSLGVETGSVKDFTSGVLGKGIGRVSGTVKKKGTPANTPVYRKVRLIREKDGLQMREVWSHPVTGAYSFDYVDELQKFTVLSYDHTGAFRAVVADGQIPELMS